MIEEGIVISTTPELATIQMVRGEKCKECTICDSIGGEFRCMQAFNSIGALTGEKVRVEIKPKTLLASSFLIFILPLIFLVGGYFLGSALGTEGREETMGMLGSVVAFVLSFVFIRLADSVMSKNKPTFAYIIERLDVNI